MAPHSSTLAWKIPLSEEPGGLQSMGLPRVRHDWATSLSLFTFMHWRRKWQPTRVLAWRIPGTGEPGRSMGLHRVGHDWSDLAAAAVRTSEVGHFVHPCFLFFFFLNIYSLIDFWLCWVFVAALRFSLAAVSGSYSSYCSGLSWCGAWALGMQAQ